MSTPGQTVSEAAAALSREDAVLDAHSCAKSLAYFLNVGGSLQEAKDRLCASYVGLPAATEALSGVATHLGIDSNTIMLEAIRDFALETFNPTAIDRRLMPKLNESVHTQTWQMEFIRHGIWRKMIYTLLERYPNCEFLNHTAMKIAEDYPDEIAAIRTPSTYVEVFKLILNGSLSDVLNSKDEVEFEEKMPGLARICCANESSYLTAQILLRRLYEQYDNAPMLRVSEELEKYARQRGHQEFAAALRQRITGMPSMLADAVKKIQQTKQLNLPALNTIYNYYNVQDPPSSTYILDSTLIEILLRAVATPEAASSLSKEDIDKCIYILAKATSSYQFDDPGGPQLHNIKTKHILEDLHDAVQTAWGEDFRDGFVNLVEAINAPVAAMGVLFFIEFKIFDADYFDSFYQSREIPVPFALIDEIAERHPLARPKIFELIKKGLTHRYRLETTQLIALQKVWVERLVFLVALGYIKPVLIYVRKEGKSLDKGTVVHFIEKVLEIANPPFSNTFSECMADVILEYQELLKVYRNLYRPIFAFADEAVISTTDISLEVQQKILKVKSIHIEID